MKIITATNSTTLTFLLLFGLFGCFNQEENTQKHSPEAEKETFQLADPNLGVTLIASEPNINSPVDIAWAPDGALFVAEMTGYPITKNKGAIKRLTDPDGDGFYDQMSVFDDDFDFPSSVMYFNGGILVADAPNIYFLKDTDLDGKADVKEIMVTGFTKGNEQYLVNALHWGLDNWIYGSGGRNGGKIKFANSSDETSIENRDFRFDPINKNIEAISGMSQFGLARDNWGNRFITLNHRFARQILLEQKHLLRNPALATDAVFDTYQSEHDRRVYTLLTGLKRFNRDPIGYFTSLSGLTANRGHLLGPDYEGSFFAGESVQAAVIHRKMELKGVTYSALNTEENAEFLASNDDWFHPVNFANGPDGAIYIVDFYRQLVEHPEWAHDDKKEGINWNLGENNGRIWRIAKKETSWDTQRMKPNFQQASVEQLVAELGDPAGWRRDMAQQLLVENQQKEAAPFLEEMLTDKRPFARLHALWTLEGLGFLSEHQLIEALNDKNEQIQVQAIRLAEKRFVDSNSKQLIRSVGRLSNHNDPLIRFNAILALGNSKEDIIKDALIRCTFLYPDYWTRVALLSSTASWAGEYARSLIDNQDQSVPDPNDFSFFRKVGNMVASTPNAIDLENWIESLTTPTNDLNTKHAAFLSGYLEALDNQGKNLPSFSPDFFSQVLDIAQDKSPEIAKYGIGLLRFSSSENHFQSLIKIVLESEDNEIKKVGLQTIAELDNTSLSESLYQNISAFDPPVRKTLISSALGSISAANTLLDATEKQQVNLTEIPEELRQALMAHTDEQLKERATKILGNAISEDRQKIIGQYLAAIENLTVDLSNGAKIFSTNCSTCHSINGYGGLLGPDLTNIGNRDDEILLTSILDPSRMVSYELKLHIISTNSGEVYSGTTSAETVSSITVRSPNGEEQTILKENIKKHTWTEKSIMPEGYERIIDEQGMADLIAFLRQPGAMGLSD